MKKLILVLLLIICLFSSSCTNSTANNENNNKPNENISVGQQIKPKKLLVLMYHCVAKNKDKSTYVVADSELEKDIKHLLNSGYKVVVPSDLIAFTNGSNNLGEKNVMLTFDDGFLSNNKYVLPLLKKYNIKGLFAVVGSYANDKNLTNNDGKYAYMSGKDVKNILPYGEIASHTYNMHNLKGRKGISKLSSETNSEYQQKILADFTKNHEFLQGLSANVQTMAYPFGIYNEISEQVLKNMGYKVTLTCNEGINYISSKQSLYKLKRYNRDGNLSCENFMQKHNIY